MPIFVQLQTSTFDLESLTFIFTVDETLQQNQQWLRLQVGEEDKCRLVSALLELIQ